MKTFYISAEQRVPVTYTVQAENEAAALEHAKKNWRELDSEQNHHETEADFEGAEVFEDNT